MHVTSALNAGPNSPIITQYRLAYDQSLRSLEWKLLHPNTLWHLKSELQRSSSRSGVLELKLNSGSFKRSSQHTLVQLIQPYRLPDTHPPESDGSSSVVYKSLISETHTLKQTTTQRNNTMVTLRIAFLLIFACSDSANKFFETCRPESLQTYSFQAFFYLQFDHCLIFFLRAALFTVPAS